MPPQQQVLVYSPSDWEDLIHEWAHSKQAKYSRVVQFSGANDMGIDVAGFTDSRGLDGVWDNYQCKHYANSLTPTTAAAEVAKILWHTFEQKYVPPRKYYFIAPRGCGTSLTKLLDKPSAMRKHVIEHWDTQCAGKVTATKKIALSGQFKEYVEAFDYGIFTSYTLLTLIDEHRQTPYHAVRFGGGLPNRPAVTPPPDETKEIESRYIQQIFEAYTDHLKITVATLDDLATRADLANHFQRQREFFYHAEALRNFARDTVPPGTYEELQDEIHEGVIEVETMSHDDGYARMNAVTQMAIQLQLTSNALISVVKVHDRKGICHQLSNENRLHWRKP